MITSKLEKQIRNYIIENKEMHYRLAYSYVKNIDDALDIVQASIYRAFSSIDTLKNSSYIKTWFYRIIVNTSLDFLRKQKKVVAVGEEYFSILDTGSVDNYENFDLKNAMDSLPEKYRSVIVLRYFEDLKIEEVAEILNLNVNTVKTYIYSALEKLRIKMNDGI